MILGGRSEPSGALGLRVIRAPLSVPWPAVELSARDMIYHGMSHPGLPEIVNQWRTRNLRNLWRGARRVLTARSLHLAHGYGALYLSVLRVDGTREDLGLASLRVVTTAGVNYLIDCLQGTVEPELLRFHGIGTGTNAEAIGDTALQTELTTEYNPNSTRATGTLAEGASANIFRTVGTNTVDGTAAVTEHGIFTQAATGGGTLLDRSVFAVVNLAINDSLQTTYDYTLTAGG